MSSVFKSAKYWEVVKTKLSVKVCVYYYLSALLDLSHIDILGRTKVPFTIA